MVYDYRPGKPFSDYTIEQQGQMVQYFAEVTLERNVNALNALNKTPDIGSLNGFSYQLK